MRIQWNYELVKKKFEELGLVLLSEAYKNGKEHLYFKCKCGKIINKAFKKVLSGQINCKKCSGQEPPSQMDVEKHFSSLGYVLLDLYKNYHTKMKYQCICGNVAYLSLAKLKRNQGCNNCKQRKTKETFMKKYGVNSCLSHPEVIKKRHETNIKRYGNINPLLNPEVKAKAEKTLMKKYGSTNGSITLSRYSKESQKVFWAIYDNLPQQLKMKTYFAELNKEFANNQPHFRYDFVISNIKKCIEYNGEAWHPRPDIDDSAVGWHVRSKHKTAKESREHEANKHQQLLEKGFDILIIWDFEVKSNFQVVVDKCLKFLLHSKNL